MNLQDAETARLVAPSSDDGKCIQPDDEPHEEPEGHLSLLLRVLSLAWPVLLSLSTYQLSSIIGTALVGHHASKDDLAAVGLGTVLCNVTGSSTVIGLSGALDTLCTQAWGAKDRAAFSRAMRQCIVVTVVAAAVATGLWSVAGPVMNALGQPHEVTAIMSDYCRLRIPGIWALPIWIVIQKVQYAMGRTRWVCVAQIISVCIGVGTTALLVAGPPKMAANGVAVGQVVQNWTGALLLGIPALFDEDIKGSWRLSTWSGALSREAGFGRFAHLSAAAMFGVAGEWWAWEVMTFMSGLLSSTDLAVQTILGSVVNILYLIESSLGSATTTVAGNAIGSMQPRVAKRAVRNSLMFCWCWMLVQNSAVYLLRHPVVYAVGGHEDVREKSVRYLPLTVLFNLLDGTQVVITAGVSALGQQKRSGPLVMAAYWLVSIPLGALLTFHFDLGLPGIWYGMWTGAFCHGCVVSLICLRTDWEKVAMDARDDRLRRCSLAAGDSTALPSPGPDDAGTDPEDR